jgi:hypothetical protein
MAFVLILLVGLIRHLKVLTRSLRTFQDEVQPLLAEIQSASTRVQDRLQGFDERAGGRLRR